MKARQRFALVFTALFLAGSSLLRAQDNLTVFWEPALALEYSVTRGYRHEFAFEKRSILYENTTRAFRVNLLDVEHFSTVRMSETQTLGVGLQYRFEEAFANDENEFRITEEFAQTHGTEKLRWEHRLRAEQRIQPSVTTHRFRYQLEASLTLGSTSGTRLAMDIESLVSFVSVRQPEWEQRLSSALEFQVQEHLRMDVGLEYRLADYTFAPAHEIFIISGMSLSLP